MSKAYSKGTTVAWKWGQGTAQAKVMESFERRVQRTLGGKRITRNGSKKNPAYLLKQEDGAQVLKSHSELDPA